jgi:hypothetical protein
MYSDHYEPAVPMKKNGATIPRSDRKDSSGSSSGGEPIGKYKSQIIASPTDTLYMSH